MSRNKFQITLSEQVVEILDKLCKSKGFSKSIIIAMAIQQMADAEKGVTDGQK